jgi:hypothetical protein
LWATLGLGATRGVAIGPQIASNPKETVLRPPQFNMADTRTALPSRAAG